MKNFESGFERMREGMYFNPFADEEVSFVPVKDALTILHLYIQGQAKQYEAEGALKYLVERYHSRIRINARLFWLSMRMEDEDERERHCQKLLEMIERAINREGLVR